LILILIGIFLIDPSKKFPGWWGLIFPVFGTCLIICSSQDSYVNKFLFSNKVLVWIGLISYPLYLWHWMLLSFSSVFLTHPPTVCYRFCLLLVSIFLSFLTYKVIEIPIRFRSKTQKIIPLLLALLISLGIAGYIIYKNEGLNVDNVKRDKIDARDSNLRLATPAENSYNKSGSNLHHIKSKSDGYEVTVSKEKQVICIKKKIIK
jgi:hypothetical protein